MAPTKRKSAIRTKTIIQHDCTQEENIQHLIESNQKLSILITGNGDPEKGMGRRLAIVQERQSNVLDTLKTIDGRLKDVNENYNLTFKEIARVGLDLSNFKAELSGEEEQKRKQALADDLKRKRTQDKYWRIAQVILIIIAAIGLYRAFNKVDNGQTSIKTEIQDQTIKSLGGQRGMMVIPLPPNYAPDTSRIDSIIKAYMK